MDVTVLYLKSNMGETKGLALVYIMFWYIL